MAGMGAYLRYVPIFFFVDLFAVILLESVVELWVLIVFLCF